MAKLPIKSHCNRCLGVRNHRLVKEVIVSDDDIDQWGNYTEWSSTYRMLECCGCESVQMRVEYWHSSIDLDDSDWDYFPARVSRRIPEWNNRLPRDWASLMREVYGALASDSRRLAVMGARTLIDLYLAATVGDHGTFEQRLDRLVAEGYLAGNNKTALQAALEAGNAAAHRGHIPNVKDMGLVMDIVENLLHFHVLEIDAKVLKANTPARPPKPQKAAKQPNAKEKARAAPSSTVPSDASPPTPETE